MALNLTLYPKDNEATSDTLIVLIHGLGAPDSTWDGEGYSWKDLLLTDPNLKNVDVSVAKYDTSHLAFELLRSFGIKRIKTGQSTGISVGKGPFTDIKTLAQELKRELNNKTNKKYENIIIVGHSMGGLIGIRYILEEIEHEEALNVRGFISLATPYNGANIALYHSLIKGLHKHAQIPSLEPNSSFLDDTIRLWQKHKDMNIDCVFCFGTNDEWVSRESAIPHIASSIWEEGIPLPGDHSSILKAINHKHPSYVVVSEHIQKFLTPKPDESIYREQLDYETRKPHTSLIGEPPSLDSNYLRRPALVKRVIDSAVFSPTEVIGVSGSGKTLFASEIVEYVKNQESSTATIYVGVNNNANFYDVLANIAYSLINFQITKPFRISSQPNLSREKVSMDIAKELNVVAKEIFILLDFTNGTCSDDFAENLRGFLENFRSEFVHVIAFGQESIFRRLSGLQRESLKIPLPIHMPGFDFEEFFQLVSLSHGHNYDRHVLWSFFEQLTSGRSAGLFARLANVFASGTIDEMKRWVTFPPDQIMEEADRIRYQHISARLRTTADKIICFILPFSLEEAKEIFSSDYISETVHEMLQYGLLRPHIKHQLEMHETIRSGLEELVPVAFKQKTHDILANHYLIKGDIIAAILHLGRAGKIEDANQIARDHFLRGENWGSLSAYVSDYKLVTGLELVNFMSANPSHSNAYILPDLFNRLGNEETANALILLITGESERFIKDFQWAWLITEATLACDAIKILDLLEFGLQQAKQKQPEVLENIVFGARRNKITVSKSLLELFARQTDDLKMQLVPLLLRDKRRDVLRRALEFLSNYLPTDVGVKRVREVNEVLGKLQLADEQEVIEFISAIPPIKDIKDIILSKSVLLGNLGNLIWEQRHVLRPVSKKLLEEKTENETVLENALRILVFSGDNDVIKLAESCIGKKGRLGSFALFILPQIPTLLDLELYKKRLFNTELNHEERLAAFYILFSVSADVDDWFKQLLTLDHASASMWEYLLIISSVQHPYNCAVPILKKMLTENNDENTNGIYASILMKLGQLPGEEITDFLISFLSNPSSVIRTTACLSLQFRRSKRAFSALLELCLQEQDEGVGQIAIVAAIASGPQEFNDFSKVWERYPHAAVWRCILAGRLQVMTEVPNLIKIANDRKEHWQIRRSAILAAGRLGSKAVMEEIAKSIFAEKLAFVQDKSYSLLGHNIMSMLALKFARDLQHRYQFEKESCHDLVADIFETLKKQASFSSDTPSGAEAAKWLFDKLETNNWPEDLSGADKVINNLNIPILYAAALRGLRVCGCLNIIEEIMSSTDTEWVLIRALCEWSKGRVISTQELDRITRIVDSNPQGSSAYVKNVLRDIGSVASREKVVTLLKGEDSKCHRISYDDVKRAFIDGQLQTDLPLIIVGLDKEQFLELVQEMSPVNDYRQCWIPKEPQLRFTKRGYSVQGVKSQSIESYPKIRATLRQALVPANRFCVQIPWHHSLLTESTSYSRNEYVKGILMLFGKQMNSERLYEELEAYGDIYLTQLIDYNTFKSVEGLFDQRIIPFLHRWSYSGNDELLEGLCRIACCISDSSIDNVLAILFYRWCELIKIRYNGRTTDNICLWRAFNCLKEHLRFTKVPDYDLRLSELLILNIPWFNKNDIIKVIAKSPRMYCKIEGILMKAAPFEHFYLDEVDRLDDAGQHLFAYEK